MTSRRVLLIGWDAADWKVIQPLMDAGRMPNLRRLVENGASGQIATLHPPLSPMLWTSIATGKRPFKHGIHGFTEPMPGGRGIRPVTNLSRTSKALWNILNQNDLRSIVIGWWPSHPAEPIDGVMVSDHYHRARGPFQEGWALPAGTVHPPEMAEALASLRVHPDSLSPELVEPVIPLAREIDQDKDKRLGECLRTLAECMSIHAAACWLLDNQLPGGKPWDFFAVYYEAIDHFCHSFMRYHPPRQSWIAERDFELYHNVVSMAYQFHDEMLGALLRKAGDDVTVILMSDHGFHPDHLRPASIPDIPAGPAIEHRELGIFAICGPGIRQNESVDGASLLDVTPTVLALYGLPVGEDMDGKVLTQSFVKNPEAAFIPSWEDVPGRDGRHPPHTRLDPVAAHEALEQMIALGYIERPDEDREVAARKTVRELRYNLGEAYQDAGRHQEAFEIFSDLRQADPDEQRFAVRLFVSCQALGMREEMQSIVDGLAPDQTSVLDYLKAQLLVADKKYAEALVALERVADALVALERVADAQMVSAGLFIQTADLYPRLGRWREAREVYQKALAIDPDNPHAHLGVCRVALRQGKFGIAAHSALDALQRVHQNPMAHFLLGRALAGMKQYERAAEAFRAAISFNPNFPEAHVRLAALLEKNLDDTEGAREHLRLARSMRNGKRARTIPSVIDGPVAERVEVPTAAETGEMPPLEESLIVVTGLPRSGTSMLMQMLAAGGMAVLSDGLREADEDNPRGYLEYEPVKNLMKDSEWLFGGKGKAVKIVAPLLAALPPGLACRVILSERDLDQVLDSQDRMLGHRKQSLPATPERRRMLKEEFARTLRRVKAMLALRPHTRVLMIEHRNAISDPIVTAGQLNQFLGGGLDVAKMANAVGLRK